ncbi:hypothetical protein MYAM1_002923 [Malassezia yamatoensis]|uniref:Saccharopine dehydrogenase NADP binding domain-containing protein n=1 Tax=Malassezia yamatoensis TaxID=253288 RepID=A0AAJ5YVG9_9BASI|nr:hypothetical protein MYAM1_002923 [Malassezia yamatoensis]
MSTAKYDVVVYGATGFTGKLVAQYLATHPQQPKVAFAGRNASKLQDVKRELVDVSKDRLESIDLMEASASDKASLQRMARSAKVVINMVGPYSLLGGFDVAKAVAEAGTGYVDLTGETDVFAHLARELHGQAKQTGAVIIPSAGFDCVPFDIGTYFAAQEIKKKLGPDAEIDHVLVGYLVKGSVSGGTLASAVNMANEPEVLKYTQPYWLSPVQGTQKLQSYFTRYLPQFDKYGSYTLFTPHNTRVVNRSWGLLEDARTSNRYGATFKYLEGFVAPNRVAAIVISNVMRTVAWLLLHVSMFGVLLNKLVPQGTGGSMEKQLQGFGNVRTLAYARDGTTKALSVFRVKGDPGYLKTATFIAEAALTIALDKDRLSPLGKQGGVLTTATFGAEAYRDRLTKYAGVTIESADVTHADAKSTLALPAKL